MKRRKYILQITRTLKSLSLTLSFFCILMLPSPSLGSVRRWIDHKTKVTTIEEALAQLTQDLPTDSEPSGEKPLKSKFKEMLQRIKMKKGKSSLIFIEKQYSSSFALDVIEQWSTLYDLSIPTAMKGYTPADRWERWLDFFAKTKGAKEELKRILIAHDPDHSRDKIPLKKKIKRKKKHLALCGFLLARDREAIHPLMIALHKECAIQAAESTSVAEGLQKITLLLQYLEHDLLTYLYYEGKRTVRLPIQPLEAYFKGDQPHPAPYISAIEPIAPIINEWAKELIEQRLFETGIRLMPRSTSAQIDQFYILKETLKNFCNSHEYPTKRERIAFAQLWQEIGKSIEAFEQKVQEQEVQEAAKIEKRKQESGAIWTIDKLGYLITSIPIALFSLTKAWTYRGDQKEEKEEEESAEGEDQ